MNKSLDSPWLLRINIRLEIFGKPSAKLLLLIGKLNPFEDGSFDMCIPELVYILLDCFTWLQSETLPCGEYIVFNFIDEKLLYEGSSALLPCLWCYTIRCTIGAIIRKESDVLASFFEFFHAT